MGFKNDNNYNNYNRVPGARGGVENNGSSNQRRHTQGQEKRRPRQLMSWEKI